MMNVLMAAINEASINSNIKVVVIASNGNVFCSGHDLKEINMARGNIDHGDDYFEKLFKKCCANKIISFPLSRRGGRGIFNPRSL